MTDCRHTRITTVHGVAYCHACGLALSEAELAARRRALRYQTGRFTEAAGDEKKVDTVHPIT